MGWVQDDPILHYDSRQGRVCAHTARSPPVLGHVESLLGGLE